MKCRWWRYTVTGHPREEWDYGVKLKRGHPLLSDGNLGTLGFRFLVLATIKRYGHAGPWLVMSSAKGIIGLSGSGIDEYDRRCDAKRFVERFVAENDLLNRKLIVEPVMDS